MRPRSTGERLKSRKGSAPDNAETPFDNGKLAVPAWCRHGTLLKGIRMSAPRPESISLTKPEVASAPRLAHSVPTVAHMLECHPATIWRMIAKKQLPTIKVGPSGGLTRIPDEAVQAVLQGRAA